MWGDNPPIVGGGLPMLRVECTPLALKGPEQGKRAGERTRTSTPFGTRT